MKLRWLIRRNTVTDAQIREYARAHDLPYMESKRQLVNHTDPVLQYWDSFEGWQTVPTVIETVSAGSVESTAHDA
jgi:hypothetical protein